MSPLYSGSADEWCYLSSQTKTSDLSVEFTIENFVDQMKETRKTRKTRKNKETTRKLKSAQFTVKDTLWHLEVIPKSNDEDRKGYVGVFLVNDN